MSQEWQPAILMPVPATALNCAVQHTHAECSPLLKSSPAHCICTDLAPLRWVPRDCGHQMLEANQYKLPMSIVGESMGMGSWRLKDSVDPAVELLVSRIESTWRELLEDGECGAGVGKRSCAGPPTRGGNAVYDRLG